MKSVDAKSSKLFGRRTGLNYGRKLPMPAESSSDKHDTYCQHHILSRTDIRISTSQLITSRTFETTIDAKHRVGLNLRSLTQFRQENPPTDPRPLTQSTMSSSPFPAIYRVFFPTIDPLIALSGALTHVLSPKTILSLYNASAKLPPAIETTTLLEINSGFLLATMPLQIIMLRLRPNDVAVWKCLQGSILIQDLGIIAAVLTSLKAQGRLDVGLLNLNEWGNLGILVALGILRAAFVLGVGLNGNGRGKGKTT